jgi:hypothetical protein
VASVLLAVEWLVAAVFVVAGCLKLRDHRQFVSEVADYRVLPSAVVGLAATLIPAVELVAGGLTFFPSTRKGAVTLLAVCLIAFSTAVVVNLLRGRTDLSCACFGRRSRRIDWLIPARNSVMLVGLVTGLSVRSDAATPSAAACVTVFLGVVGLWVVWESRALGTPIEGAPL